MNTQLDHPFRIAAGRVIESGRAKTLVMGGNVHDLFYLPPEYTGTKTGEYVHLCEYLIKRWGMTTGKNDLVAKKRAGVVFVSYGLNGPVRFRDEEDEKIVQDAFTKSQTRFDGMDPFIAELLEADKTRKDQARMHWRELMNRTIEKPAVALQLLRHLCKLSRESKQGDPLYGKRLIILIEWADMMLPEGEIVRLNEADRHRIMICQDWFSDPAFVRGQDAVVLITESASLINHRLTSLPYVAKVQIPSPDTETRAHFIDWFDETSGNDAIQTWDTKDKLALFTAGLSLQALHQMLTGSVHEKTAITLQEVIARVEQYIQSQLGEGVVEFKQPSHTLDDVIGCRAIKYLLRTELIQRFQSTGKDALTGAAVAGPIGGGKTFVFEAVAALLGMPVMVLKNIRSQWFGQTDVILEKLYRVLCSLPKVMIFIDEADTVFGGLGEHTHETERRLTGTIQTWMSDPRLKGKVVWLLMTARIHLLSPDIRRPGRVGDLIIPVFDPVGDDFDDFLAWTLKPVLETLPTKETEERKKLEAATKGYSAAAFGALRSELVALKIRHPEAQLQGVLELSHELLSPHIGAAREYQILQALLNTTRRSLLPNPNATEEDRKGWINRIRELEAEGIR